MSNSLLPHNRVSKRIMVFAQPGLEVFVAASPLLGDTKAFNSPPVMLGKLMMNSKRSLWFVLPNGDRIHLAKCPQSLNGKQRNSKRNI